MFQSDREFLGVITQQITNFFDKNHYCNGRLNKQETNEVIDKIQKLVNDIMR